MGLLILSHTMLTYPNRGRRFKLVHNAVNVVVTDPLYYDKYNHTNEACMIKKFITCASLFLLSACNSNQGYDGYIFGKKQYEKNAVLVVVATYKTDAEFKAAAKKYIKTDYDKVAAFSLVNPNTDVCTIHMMDPSVKYQPEFIGHEFAHCLYGQWHTNNQSRS